MNTRPVITRVEHPVSLSVAFNQDRSCFAVALNTGLCVFNADPCELRVSRDFNAGIGCVEMLGKTNYLALVGGGRLPKFQQNKIVIWDDSKQKVAITLDFRSLVLRVRLSRSRIVVALHNSVHVYAFSLPPERLAVYETADNPFGLLCLGTRAIAFPGRTIGQVQVVEIATGNVNIIPAHAASLRAVEISPDGQTIATASETGTLIRTFSTQSCARTGELRRGVDHADIFSLAFSPHNRYLAVTSDKGTMHIFDNPGFSDLPDDHINTSSKPADLRRLSTASSSSYYMQHDDQATQKWGILGKIPLMPRVFSDVYSTASIDFTVSDDNADPIENGNRHAKTGVPGLAGARPVKGVIGWIDNQTIVVLGAGRDGRWEKYALVDDHHGRKTLVRNGWKRYLGV